MHVIIKRIKGGPRFPVIFYLLKRGFVIFIVGSLNEQSEILGKPAYSLYEKKDTTLVYV